MATKRQNHIKEEYDLNLRDHAISEKIHDLMRLPPEFKRLRSQEAKEKYELAYSRYEKMMEKLYHLGNRIDALPRISQMDKSTPEYKHAIYVYYKARKRRALEEEIAALQRRAPKKAAALLKQLEPKKIGRPRLRRASKYLQDQPPTAPVQHIKKKTFGENKANSLRAELISLMPPTDLDRADTLLSTWILEDLEGDNQLIGRYVGSRLDKLSARINALQETTYAQ